MTAYRRPTDEAIGAALRSGLPRRAPEQLGDRIWRSIGSTPQRPTYRLIVRPLGLSLDPRTLALVGALIALLIALGILLVVGSPRRPIVPAIIEVSTYHGDAARTGVMPGPGPVGSPKIEWDVTLKGPVRGQPSVVGGVVYVADGSGDVEARSEASGAPIWSSRVPAAVDVSVAVSGGRLFVGDESGTMTAFDAPTGRSLWQRATGGPIRAAPIIEHGLLFVGSMDRTLYVLDPATGRVRWRVPVPGPISRSIAIADGVVYVPSDGGSLTALDEATGRQLWQLALGAGNLGTLAVVDGVVYAPAGVDVATAHRALFAIDAHTHAVRWEFTPRTNATVFVGGVSRGLVFAPSWEDDRMYALDAATGREQWEFRTGGSNGNLAALVGTTLYLPSGDRTLYALDTLTGSTRWTLPIMGVPGPVAVIDGRVFLGTDLGRLVAIGGAGSQAASPGG